MYNDRRSHGVFALPQANLASADRYSVKLVGAYFFPLSDSQAIATGKSNVKQRTMDPNSGLMVVVEDEWQEFGVPISCPHAIASFMMDTGFVGDPNVIKGRAAAAYRSPSHDLIAIGLGSSKGSRKTKL